MSTTITQWRKDAGLTLDELAASLGLKSKGHLSQIESSGRCTARIALAIEAESGGRVDASSLNDDIAAARGIPAEPIEQAA